MDNRSRNASPPTISKETAARAGIIVAFVLLACVYAVGLWAPAVGLFHDDGIYVVTAKALASGQGYQIISLPNPIAQTKYPILFPALLALVWKLYPAFPANVIALKVVPFLAAVLWLWLSHKLLVRAGVSGTGAVLAVILTASTGWAFFLSTNLLSETLFAALCAASLLLLLRIEQHPASARLVCMTGLVVGLTMLTRTAGVALLVAGVVALVHKRSFRNAVLLTFVVALVYSPWLGWTAMHPFSGRTLDAYYTAENYRTWNVLFGFSLEEKWAVAAWNIVFLTASPLALLSLPINPLTCLAVGTMLGYGIVRGVFRERSIVISVFLVCYSGLLVLWAWPPIRFVAPVLPLILLVLWRATDKLRTISGSQWVLRLAVLAVTVHLGVGLYSCCRHILLTGAHKPDDWVSLSSLTSWVRTSTRSDAVLLSNLDPMIYLYTGRSAFRGFYADPVSLFYGVTSKRNPVVEPCELAGEIVRCRATHLLVTPNKGYIERVGL